MISSHWKRANSAYLLLISWFISCTTAHCHLCIWCQYHFHRRAVPFKNRGSGWGGGGAGAGSKTCHPHILKYMAPPTPNADFFWVLVPRNSKFQQTVVPSLGELPPTSDFWIFRTADKLTSTLPPIGVSRRNSHEAAYMHPQHTHTHTHVCVKPFPWCLQGLQTRVWKTKAGESEGIAEGAGSTVESPPPWCRWW